MKFTNLDLTLIMVLCYVKIMQHIKKSAILDILVLPEQHRLSSRCRSVLALELRRRQQRPRLQQLPLRYWLH